MKDLTKLTLTDLWKEVILLNLQWLSGAFNSIWLALLFCLPLIGAIPDKAYSSSYYGSGYVRVGVGIDPGNFEWQERTQPLSPVTSVSDQLVAQGPALNNATASYHGSLATGEVGAYVDAENGLYFGEWLEASAEAVVTIGDTLYFHVPAGLYPEGVEVSATGFVKGYLKESYWAQSRFSFYAQFGSDEYEVSRNFEGYGESIWTIDDVFTLTSWLVAPGTYLNSDQIFQLGVQVSLGEPASLIASTTANGMFGDKESTYGTVDFWNTGGITSITVPTGVTWTSASGVFLIPIPTTIVLMGSGLLGLLGIGIRQRRSL